MTLQFEDFPDFLLRAGQFEDAELIGPTGFTGGSQTFSHCERTIPQRLQCSWQLELELRLSLEIAVQMEQRP